jgi:hypothetical protein
MLVAQSPAHYINSSKGCPSITESVRLSFYHGICSALFSISTVRHRRGIASGGAPLFGLSRKQFSLIYLSLPGKSDLIPDLTGMHRQID